MFNGSNADKQFSVQFQLALVLYRLGSYGEGSTLVKIASLFGIGDGGTIHKVTKRVFESILTLEQQFLEWPSKEERHQLVLETFDELPHCIGYVDGTEIPLQERPVFYSDPESYYSKEKEHSIKLQAVCDYTLRFRHILVGYTGSVHDARMYNNCVLATQCTDYFTEPQYLFGDCAYRQTITVITPFRQNSKEMTHPSRVAFNRFACSKRVRIEHGFGVMKEKFPSLKCLNIRISDEESHRLACTWIRVTCVLHNILLPHYDEEDFEFISVHGSTVKEGDEDNNCAVDEDDQYGKAKRIALFETISARTK